MNSVDFDIMTMVINNWEYYLINCDTNDVNHTVDRPPNKKNTHRTRGGALGRVQNLRRQYCWVTQVNLISYSLTRNDFPVMAVFIWI